MFKPQIGVFIKHYGGEEKSICNPKLYLDIEKKQMTMYELNYLLFPVSINHKTIIDRAS